VATARQKPLRVCCWEVESGQELHVPLGADVRVWISELAFTPDGRALRAVGTDGLRRWGLPRGWDSVPPLKDQAGTPLLGLLTRADGTVLLPGYGDGVVRLWDAGTGKLFGRPLPYASKPYRVELSPDGRHTAVLFNGTARLWDLAAGQPVGEPMQHRSLEVLMRFAGDGNTLATADDDGICLWRVPDGKPLSRIKLPSEGTNQVRYLSRDLTWALVQPFRVPGAPEGQRPSLRTVETATGKVRELLSDSSNGERAADVSADERSLVTLDEKHRRARVYDLAAGKLRGPVIPHAAGASFWPVLSPDGRRVVTARDPGAAQLWDVAGGAPVGPAFEHAEVVECVAFSPDGKAVLTGSADRTARLWDTATGRPLCPPLVHPGPVCRVAFNARADRFLTAVGDDPDNLRIGTTRVWAVPQGTGGDPEYLSLWAQVATGMELDPHGHVRPLDPAAWAARRDWFREREVPAP
jgi:WD40 repeat protein